VCTVTTIGAAIRRVDVAVSAAVKLTATAIAINTVSTNGETSTALTSRY